jgi:hypothetical protein
MPHVCRCLKWQMALLLGSPKASLQNLLLSPQPIELAPSYAEKTPPTATLGLWQGSGDSG